VKDADAWRRKRLDPDATSRRTLSSMSARRYRVKDVADLSGVTVRTLHHYDRMGLLVPERHSDSGYRLYDEAALVRLQQILVWRELGFPLAEIKSLLDDPDFDRRDALRAQRETLATQAARYHAMIRSVDVTLRALEGEEEMSAETMFEGFDPAAYEEEVRERWGDTDAYRESARRTKSYSKADWQRIRDESGAIYTKLASEMAAGRTPDAPAVLELAEAHRRHIDRWFYPCSPEMHRGLAELYTSDERFTAAIDAYGAGLASFLARAIHAGPDAGS